MASHAHSYTFSDFRDIHKLAQGGFGSTYLAIQNFNGQEVCLKKIRLRRGVSQQRIEREAKLLSELKDDHIIKYIGSFVESESFYIVMEYAKEGSLKDLIQVCYLIWFPITISCLFLCLRSVIDCEKYSVNVKYLLFSIK